MSELVRQRLQDTVKSAITNTAFLDKDIAKERQKIEQAEATIARHEAEIAREKEALAEANRLLGLMPTAPVESDA